MRRIFIVAILLACVAQASASDGKRHKCKVCVKCAACAKKEAVSKLSRELGGPSIEVAVDTDAKTEEELARERETRLATIRVVEERLDW
ncbi:hypothetical protein HN446_00540 [bacterium]|jgi:hypothetical protein|nr:hypothetical protein [bacterium]